MRTLSIDIETYSSVELKKSGVYPYVKAPDFQVLMLAFAYDDEPAQVIDLTRYALPAWLRADILDSRVRKTAYNAPFEITALEEYLGVPLDHEAWDCTLVQAARAGYPIGLDACAIALQVPSKYEAGTSLINFFSKPCKPVKSNGFRSRNFPAHDVEKWELFLDYCRNDVEVERAVRRKVENFRVSDFERRMWRLDQHINRRGVKVDIDFVQHVINVANWYNAELREEAIEITGLQNPNSRAQLLEWLISEGEDEDIDALTELETLRKADVADLLESAFLPDNVRRLLEIRQEMSKSSLRKYNAMLAMSGADGRVRGLFQYYGASRTGRWAGRGVQLQNLPRNFLPDLDCARELAAYGDGLALDVLFGNVPDTLSQLVRTALVPERGKEFIVSDFSAIEARVIAWLAGERWRIDAFRDGKDIYIASAAQMFGIPFESINPKTKEGKALRARGKVAELALGYAGTKNAMINMGAIRGGLTEDELMPIVYAWRRASPMIVKLWKDVENAARFAIENPGKMVRLQKGIVIGMQGKDLCIQLPSGRILSYVDAFIQYGSKYKDIYYRKADKKSWLWTKTYGGKLVENIVQAIARDCLAEALMRLHERGFDIVMHVHDEVVLEQWIGSVLVETINKIMAETIPWAPDLLLGAEGFKTMFYKKD